MTFDIQDAIQQAAHGEVIDLPEGLIVTESPVVLDKPITLRGSWEGRGPSMPTRLVAPAVEVRYSGAKIQGLCLDFANEGSGVFVEQRCTIENCEIRRSAGNGITITSDVQRTPPTNANEWRLINVVINSSAGHGLYVKGGDTNVGYGEKVSSVGNGGWGIYDEGFLGSTYIACHVASNVGGAYKASGASARHTFIGCYSEGGQQKSEFNQRSLILGGLHGAGFTGGHFVGESAQSGTQFTLHGEPKVVVGRFPNSGIDVVAPGDHQHGWSLAWFDPPTGTIQFRHSRLNALVGVMLTTNVSTLKDEQGNTIPAGEVVFPKGFWVPGSGGYKKVNG